MFAKQLSAYGGWEDWERGRVRKAEVGMRSVGKKDEEHRRWGERERGRLGEKKMNVQHPTSNIERRIGKI